MQVAPESLVKTQELVDANRGEQEGYGKACRIDQQEKNAARNRLRVRSQHQDGGENRADARGPAKGTSESEQETAGNARKRSAGLGLFRRLAAKIVEAQVTVEPACQRRSRKKNKCYGKKLH